MKKLLSLIKTSMSNNMNLFKINSKNKNETTKRILPIFIAIACFISIWSYANIMMEPLVDLHVEFVLLTIFVLFTSIMTLVEGIYKSSSLLFNCKDDNLLLSLPIKKSTVLFIRIFKFYVFELLYNSLFLLPAMIVYIRYVSVDASFYISSLVALLVLPILPIVISCIIGGTISASSAKFKSKNLVQIILTTVFLLAILYVSYNLDGIITDIAKNATSINEMVTKLYYPAGAYINLVTNFNIQELIIFIAVHLIIFTITIMTLSKIYYKINSKVKVVKSKLSNNNYRIRTNKPVTSIIKKEIRKFLTSPVFVTNAGFGLILFIVGCILICVKIDSVVSSMASNGIEINAQQIIDNIPVVLFGLVCFTSLMTSITSSMISLEGKSFTILKSLPIKPNKIILGKILAAIIIMVPLIIIGDMIMFIRFKFNIAEIIMILIASIILPLVSETIGILVNLKYPKMDAENDTEVVKQSMSSMISVFIGMILTGLTIFLLVKLATNNIQTELIILLGLILYGAIYIGLLIYMNKKSIKEFNAINV